MKIKFKLLTLIGILATVGSFGQLGAKKEVFTKADTLRGSLNENRTWWNVLRYDITVQPDYATKTIKGNTLIRFEVLKTSPSMQIDLQQ